MGEWTDNAIETVRRHFEATADPERAEQMAAYMRNQFPFYGIGATDRKAICRDVWALLPPPTDSGELAAFARGCYALSQREWHNTAVSLLRRQAKHLTPADLPLIRELIVTHAWWDTVDEMAAHVLGRIVFDHPQSVSEMDEWVRSDQLWVARAAILHQLGYKNRTDPERLFAYCDLRADEKDFFYRKAIGWALRQYARTDPEAVRAYVESRRDRLSALSIREALKHLE